MQNKHVPLYFAYIGKIRLNEIIQLYKCQICALVQTVHCAAIEFCLSVLRCRTGTFINFFYLNTHMMARRTWARVVVFSLVFTAIGLAEGNQRPAYAESLAQQIVCKVFTQLNEVSQGVKVPFPPFRPGCGERGGIEVIKHVVGGTASAGDFLIHIKDSSGVDIDESPQPGTEIGRNYGNVPAGLYTISESGGPSGYTATFSGNCSSTGAITVTAGSLSSCTITNTFSGSVAAACSNGSDDDGDGFTDTNDPNCHTDGNPSNAASYDPNQTSESGSLPACWNNVDDDGDGKKDFPVDPGCTSATDTSETDSGGGNGGALQCADGADNDGDGKIDMNDPGCSSALDNDETDPGGGGGGNPQCSDGIDNDGDGKVDAADSACHTDFNADNASSYDGSRTNEAAVPPQVYLRLRRLRLRTSRKINSSSSGTRSARRHSLFKRQSSTIIRVARLIPIGH